MMRKILTLLEMIQFQHSIFALPWAVAGAFYAADGLPPLRPLLWIFLAMISARTAAMTFNRIADAAIDAKNPRTQNRAIPRGLISRTFAAGMTVTMIALFALSAAMLNRLCLILTPVALVVLLGYSYTKRFTALCHFVLGLSLAMAPIGGWLAIRPEWTPFPLLLGATVLFWIAGADILYACEDFAFDREMRLHSVPALLGIPQALVVSALCHVISITVLVAAGWIAQLGILFYSGVGLIALLLAVEHWILRPTDLRRLNRSFFQINAVVSLMVLAICLGDLWQRHRL